jgi:hypothetical protein
MINDPDKKTATQRLLMQQMLSVSIMSLVTTALLAVSLDYMQREVIVPAPILVEQSRHCSSKLQLEVSHVGQ